jgi:hypothetical protein
VADPTNPTAPSAPNYGSMMDIVKSLRPGGGDAKMPGMSDLMSSPAASGASYDNIFGLIKASGTMPGVTDTALPAIAQLLDASQGPAADAIKRETEANVAGAQSDAMKRGLTGSDIEAGNMTMARGQGQLALGNLFSQNASKLGDYIMQAVSGDTQAHREALLNLAQAFGQKISSDQELQMFREQLSANMAMASSANKASLWGAGIGAVGNIAGGALGGRK